MDFKSMLIGGLGTALLFVSIGAGVQSEPTTIQVTENPFPYEVVDVTMTGFSGECQVLLNRETGEMEQIYSHYDSKSEGKRYSTKTFDYVRHQ